MLAVQILSIGVRHHLEKLHKGVLRVVTALHRTHKYIFQVNVICTYYPEGNFYV